MARFPSLALNVLGPVSLMWSWSDLMTVTIAGFGSAALPRELLPIPWLEEKNMFPIVFLLPLSNHKVSSHWRTTGRPFWLVCKSVFLSLCLFLFILVSLSLYSDFEVVQSSSAFINPRFELNFYSAMPS